MNHGTHGDHLLSFEPTTGSVKEIVIITWRQNQMGTNKYEH